MKIAALLLALFLASCGTLTTEDRYDMDRHGHEHVHQDVTFMVRVPL